MSKTTRKKLSVPEKHRRHTAFHEAGHAVIGELVGINTVSVSIIPDGESLGRWRHESGGLANTYEGITALYAGDKAEELDPTLSLRHHGDGQDRATARERALALYANAPLTYDNPHERLDAAEKRAGDMVREQRWVIAHVATELLKRHTLTGDELREEMAIGKERSAERARMEREPWFLATNDPPRGTSLPTPKGARSLRDIPGFISTEPDKSAPWYMPTAADADHSDPAARAAYMESLGLPDAKAPAERPSRALAGQAADPADWEWVPSREVERSGPQGSVIVRLGGYFKATRAFVVTICGNRYEVAKGEQVAHGHELTRGLKAPR